MSQLLILQYLYYKLRTDFLSTLDTSCFGRSTMLYSLYIYDRHCRCVYYHDWHRSKRPKPAVEGGILPGVSHAVSSARPSDGHPGTITSPYGSPRNTLSSNTGIVIAVNEPEPAAVPRMQTPPPPPPTPASTGLPFDEEAKLVYGVVISLRNMIKKLAGRDEQFTNYRTSAYKLHLYETLSGYKFVMLSDPGIDSLRVVLRQIYVGPFLEYVVRNPLMSMDSQERGIDNEYFRASVDRLIRGLAVFS